jgi:hypothetical protein
MPRVVRLSSIWPKSPIADGVPAEEPNDTPILPLVTSGSSCRPASCSAISAARVASSATRPMLRIALRL